MKKTYNLVLLALMALMMAAPATTQAQNDTLTVEWLVNDQLVVNALYQAIVSDTVAGGDRANPKRVYKLRQGGFYYLTEQLSNNGWHLNIVGEPGNPSDPTANPPMLQVEHREDASNPEKMILAGGDLTLKNVIVNGKTTRGNLPYEIIRSDAAGARLVFDNVIFEYASWGIFSVYGRDSKVYVTNSHFRNLLSHNQPWGGRGFSVWADVDTVYVENTNFMNIGGFGLQIEGGAAKFFWFNHNTIVNNGRQVILYSWHRNSYITNNLLMNGFWHGEDTSNFDAIRTNTPDLQFTGMFNIEPLPSRYGLDVARKIVFSNNAHFREQVLEDFYANPPDPALTFSSGSKLRPQPVFNERTTNFFAAFDGMVNDALIEGQNPGFTTVPNNQAQMTAFITALRSGASEVPLWYWDPGRDNTTADQHYSIQWPLPENLTYSNQTLRAAGLGGFPLGNLNSYPAQKATWMTQRATLAEQIIAKGGGEIVTTLVASAEAEQGTKTGAAADVVMPNLYAVRVLGSGNPSWTFNMDAGGTYDITVRKRTWYGDTNPGRQTNLIVNGGAAIPITLGMNIDGATLPWAEPVAEDVTLNAGSNTITLGRSWGYMEYQTVTIKDQQGNVVRTLYASRMTNYDGTDISCPTTGSGPCASQDAYVNVTGGTVSVSMNAPRTGNYAIKVNYLLTAGSASADVFVNGNNAGTLSFGGNNNTLLDVNLGNLNLTAGANTFEIRNVTGSLGIDRMDLFEVTTATSLDRNELPDGFALSNNYPNPFNPTTSIDFTLPVSADVRLVVYNVLGQRVAVLADGLYAPGTHTVRFDGRAMASGTYLFRFETGSHSVTRKMTLLK